MSTKEERRLDSVVTSKSNTLAKAIFCAAAFISFIFSIYLYFNGDKQGGIFVGIWVPSILAAGTMLMSGGQNE